jgi:hypothetical protein
MSPIVRQPSEMRTTYIEMHLLNDISQMCATSFIQNRKDWGDRREIEKERTDGE